MVVAVIGFDISLNNLQQDAVAGGRELYKENGSISIISPSKVVAGHSQDASQLDKNLQAVRSGQATEILDFLGRSEPRTFIDKRQISVPEPLAPLPGAKPWGVLLGVPQQILQAPAEALKKQMDDERLRRSALEFGLGSIAALLGIVLIWLAARGVTRPLLRLAAMLEDIAEG
ncbi:hypothetical protein ACSFE6_01045 [Pseudomonas baetica]|uniref:hypothetical protein n=1 Tax=Pseudomonas baetica TaxID=674054 RepID=UPI003EEEB0F8